MNTLAQLAFERAGGGTLWVELPAALQDTIAELVDAAIDAHDAAQVCGECGGSVGEITCEKCWLGKHAETCHDCQDEIPMKEQRCSACTRKIAREVLRERGVSDTVIQALDDALRTAP